MGAMLSMAVLCLTQVTIKRSREAEERLCGRLRAQGPYAHVPLSPQVETSSHLCFCCTRREAATVGLSYSFSCACQSMGILHTGRSRPSTDCTGLSLGGPADLLDDVTG